MNDTNNNKITLQEMVALAKQAKWEKIGVLEGVFEELARIKKSGDCGEVFRYLGEINSGSIIYLYSGEQVFSYIVVKIDIIPEKYQVISNIGIIVIPYAYEVLIIKILLYY